MVSEARRIEICNIIRIRGRIRSHICSRTRLTFYGFVLEHLTFKNLKLYERTGGGEYSIAPSLALLDKGGGGGGNSRQRNHYESRLFHREDDNLRNHFILETRAKIIYLLKLLILPYLTGRGTIHGSYKYCIKRQS